VVSRTHDIVIESVRWGGVNEARAGVEGNVLTEDHRDGTLLERVRESQVLELGPVRYGEDLLDLEAVSRQTGVG
jgi:hypothetical protein